MTTLLEQQNQQLNQINQKIQYSIKDTRCYQNLNFEPEIYIDEIFSELCDFNIELGIETFSLDNMIAHLSESKEFLSRQLVVYTDSVRKLQDECEKREEEHRMNIEKCKKRMEKIETDFSETEKNVREMSADIIQSGERLQDLRRERTHFFESKEILKMFSEFNNQDFDAKKYNLDHIDKKFVTRMKKLRVLCRTLSSEETVWGIQCVGDLYNRVHSKIMNAFEEAFIENDLVKMKTNADLMYHLNGGNDVVDFYLEYNPFLNDDNDVVADEKLASQEEEIPTDKLFINSSRVQSFFKRMIQQMQKEKTTIDKIFIQKEEVTELMLKNIFEYRIDNFLNVYLHESSKNVLEYLYKLYDAYTQSFDYLAKSLVNIEGIKMKKVDEMVNLTFKEDVEQFYERNETNLMEELFKTSKKEYETQRKQFKIDKPSKINIDECHQVLSLEKTKELIREYTYANQRAKKICLPKSVAPFVKKIFTICAKWIDDVVIDLSEKLVVFAQKVPSDGIKSASLLNAFLTMFSNLVTTVDILQNTIQEDVLPQMQFNFNLYNHCEEIFGTKIERIEKNICKAFETILEWIKKIIQNSMKYKNEFKFKDETDDTWTRAPQCTLIMREMCQYIQQYIELFDKYIKGINHRNFMTIFGKELFTVLVDGFSKLKITPFSGGFLFMYDCRYIYELVRLASFPSQIKFMFANMSMLFKIYCVDKDHIPDLIRTIGDDGGFDFIEPNEMLKCRTDYTKMMYVDYP